jgi:putative toxin-antitoxin system antitoxin component (TIGR02293 family)
MKRTHIASKKRARLVRAYKAATSARRGLPATTPATTARLLKQVPGAKTKLSGTGTGKTHVFISHYIERRGARTTAKTFSPQQVIEVIYRGLPIGELEYLRAHLDVPIDRLTQNIGLSRATFHRRKAAGRLTADESDKVVRFAQLLGLANKVLENEDDARRWLTSPQYGLGGAVPLNYARTEVGAREVEDLLNRIEYGVYS